MEKPKQDKTENAQPENPESPEKWLLKYRELYNFSKETFEEELNRSATLEQKATIYISALTFLLGIFGFFGKNILNSLLPPQTLLECIILVLVACWLATTTICWFKLFDILKMYDYAKRPTDVIDFFNRNKIDGIYYDLAKKLITATEKNRMIGDQKGLLIKRVHRLLRVIVILIVIISLLFSMRIWLTNDQLNSKENAMTDDPKETPQTPEVEIAAPEFVMLSNSADMSDTIRGPVIPLNEENSK